LADFTSFVPSYVVSKIFHASLADLQFEIFANSDGEVLGTEHGRLYHLKDEHSSEGLVQVLYPLV